MLLIFYFKTKNGQEIPALEANQVKNGVNQSNCNSNDSRVKKVMEIKFETCDSCNYLETDEILN